ncbi:MAG: phosphoribosyltransferase [Saprospiraceae bacterium]|nr:phosphoribosyltransferase [Bacteroidia bacterium]NNE15984.1 phosphoribosyltransferase [Saprospiraceae bacterium]NNL91999.1 phosphoribosyltransferase [Saprospiraceae bacterium]
MKVLSNKQIEQKVDRLAYEILENNHEESMLVFLGINNNGLRFAKYLQEVYESIAKGKSILGGVRLNAANPLNDPITIDVDIKTLNGKVIILVDDVANTGRTIFYGAKPLMEFIPKKVEVAVLVDRKHKLFPIEVDYVGLSLATTLKENIRVELSRKTSKSVHLE